MQNYLDAKANFPDAIIIERVAREFYKIRRSEAQIFHPSFDGDLIFNEALLSFILPKIVSAGHRVAIVEA